jgi:transposase-like protein
MPLFVLNGEPETPKQEIVAASLVPGSSVSIVARPYEMNANSCTLLQPP